MSHVCRWYRFSKIRSHIYIAIPTVHYCIYVYIIDSYKLYSLCLLYFSTGVFTLYPCNATTIEEGQFESLLTEFKISAYTRDKEFDPIVLYFYKNCNSNSPKGDDFIV